MPGPPTRSVDIARLLEEHLRRLPRGATCKGLFFRATLERAKKALPNFDAPGTAGIEDRRYVSFFDYPYSDYLKLNVACAKAIYADEPPADGMRRLGATAYDALLENQVGRVIFGAFGSSFEYVAMMGGKGYSVSLNFGKVDVERIDARHVRYRFHDTPAFLDTFQVGVVEGAMRACGVRGEVRVTSTDIANAVFDITWETS